MLMPLLMWRNLRYHVNERLFASFLNIQRGAAPHMCMTIGNSEA